MVKPHSYSISDNNAKFLKSLAKEQGRSVSNTLDRIIDNLRQADKDRFEVCPHGSIDPKTNMCRDCHKIIN